MTTSRVLSEAEVVVLEQSLRRLEVTQWTLTERLNLLHSLRVARAELDQLRSSVEAKPKHWGKA